MTSLCRLSSWKTVRTGSITSKAGIPGRLNLPRQPHSTCGQGKPHSWARTLKCLEHQGRFLEEDQVTTAPLIQPPKTIGPWKDDYLQIWNLIATPQINLGTENFQRPKTFLSINSTRLYTCELHKRPEWSVYKCISAYSTEVPSCTPTLEMLPWSPHAWCCLYALKHHFLVVWGSARFLNPKGTKLVSVAISCLWFDKTQAQEKLAPCHYYPQDLLWK